MFVQLDVGLANSELVDEACAALGLDTDTVIGKLFRFWEAVLEARCDGLIGPRSDKWMEEAVAWRGETGRFAAFARARLIDDEGVARGWDERYGALNRKRARDQRSQAAKRRREGNALPTDVSADAGADISADAGARTEPESVPFSLTSSSPSLSVAVEQQHQVQKQRDQGKERLGSLVATLAEAGLDLAGFEASDRAVIEGALRGSRSALALAVVIAGHLKEHSAVVVGRAFREYAASEQPWSSQLFAGFVRTAAKQVQIGENRRRAQRETVHIDREEIESEERRREEAEITEQLATFGRSHPEEFEKLRVQAEASVDRRAQGLFRKNMVRIALVRLIHGCGAAPAPAK